VAVANISALRDEHVVDNVRDLGPVLHNGLDEIASRHPTVREVRGTGFFYAIELMADRDSGTELSDEQSLLVLRGVLPRAMHKVGLITRPDDRGATMMVLAPPLVADMSVIGELLEQTDAVMSEVDRFVSLHGGGSGGEGIPGTTLG
jgi:adenosylmethionine-8-amino-7-oxononanoate aminotransferase